MEPIGEFYLAAFHGLNGLPLGVELTYRLHANGRQHTALYAYGSQSRAQGQTVDDGGAHAHLVALDAVETLAGAAQAAENVAAANDDTNLYSHLTGFLNLGSILIQALHVNAVTLLAHQALTT